MLKALNLSKTENLSKKSHKSQEPISSSILKNMNKAEEMFFQKRLSDNYKLTERVEIPIKNKPSYRTTFMNSSYGMSEDSPLSVLSEIMDNDNLREGLQLISEKLPESAKFAFVESGYDLKKIAEKGLMIPEFKKALRYCDLVMDSLKKEQSIPFIKDNPFNPFEKGVVNEKALNEQIQSLEEQFDNFGNGSFYMEESMGKDLEKLEKLHQFHLANEFRKINQHHLHTAMAEIGLKQIKTAGNALYFITQNQIGVVIKLSMTLSSAILEVYDKSWKAKNFKLDTEENHDLTPLDYLDINQVRQRRDKLIHKNVQILLPMLKYLDRKRNDDPKQNMIVSALLKGFWCKPEEIREKVLNDEDLRYEVEDKMKRLYRF